MLLKEGESVRINKINLKLTQTYLDIDGDGNEEEYLRYISGIQMGFSNDFTS